MPVCLTIPMSKQSSIVSLVSKYCLLFFDRKYSVLLSSVDPNLRTIGLQDISEFFLYFVFFFYLKKII